MQAEEKNPNITQKMMDYFKTEPILSNRTDNWGILMPGEDGFKVRFSSKRKTFEKLSLEEANHILKNINNKENIWFQCDRFENRFTYANRYKFNPNDPILKEFEYYQGILDIFNNRLNLNNDKNKFEEVFREFLDKKAAKEHYDAVKASEEEEKKRKKAEEAAKVAAEVAAKAAAEVAAKEEKRKKEQVDRNLDRATNADTALNVASLGLGSFGFGGKKNKNKYRKTKKSNKKHKRRSFKKSNKK